MGTQPPVAAMTVIAAAVRLLQAHDYAQDAGIDPWQFAVDLADLQPITTLDVRWLIARGYAEHAQEMTREHDPNRNFRPVSPTAFPARTCLVLTECGAAALRPLADVFSRIGSVPVLDHHPHIAPASHQISSLPTRMVLDPAAAPIEAPPRFGSTDHAALPARPLAVDEHTEAPQHSAPEKPANEAQRDGKRMPRWDAQMRELRLGNKLVKRFRVPAPNQELILNVFEEEGWPECIDDPLPPKGDDDPIRRLQATIKSLNRCQAEGLMRFHGNGGGHVVCWERA